eukprot:4566479-Pyramimonas_sp.AAC.1
MAPRLSPTTRALCPRHAVKLRSHNANSDEVGASSLWVVIPKRGAASSDLVVTECARAAVKGDFARPQGGVGVREGRGVDSDLYSPLEVLRGMECGG